MRLLGIAGSVRDGSHNRRLLEAAAAAAPAGVELEIVEQLAALPHYSEDLDVDPAPAPVRDLRAAVAAADGLLIATPEYNGSIPGVLKNALDWLSRPWERHALRGKPVAVAGASTGLFGAVWAQAEVRRVLAHVGARVVDRELPFGQADGAFAPDGGLRDEAHAAALRDLVAALVAQARAPVGEPA